MATAGRPLPRALKLPLARRSMRLGYLLLHDGDLEIDDYLGDFRVAVNARSDTERAMLSRSFEPDVLRVIASHVQPGDYCLDVGANVGAITLALAKAAGPAGRIFAFEPGPPFFSRLRENLARNATVQPIVHATQIGLSDRPGELFWGEDVEFRGNAHLLGNRGTKVPVTTLDHFFAEPPARLDFVKVDVEGMEGEVLRGGEKLLRRFRPVILFESLLEFERHVGKPIRRHTQDWLLGLGYELYKIRSDGSLTVTRYPDLSANTLAIPRES